MTPREIAENVICEHIRGCAGPLRTDQIHDLMTRIERAIESDRASAGRVTDEMVQGVKAAIKSHVHYVDGLVHSVDLLGAARAALEAARLLSVDAAKAMRHEVIQAAYYSKPLCRDCADEDGTCPTDGRPCDPYQNALQVLREWAAQQLAKRKVPADIRARSDEENENG